MTRQRVPAIVDRFGRNVAAARAFRRMRQADLAKAAGIDTSYVSLVESGRRTVAIDIAWRIADALNLPLGALTDQDTFDTSHLRKRPAR